MKCFLYFDIGNTNTKIAVRSGDAPLESFAFPTNERQTSDQFGLYLEGILRKEHLTPGNITACIGLSVVPGMSAVVDAACRRFLDCPLTLVPDDLPIPLENRYARPYEVGADRLAGAFAARRMFPDAHSIIVVDFGTATTFDCVTGNAYLGGLISPGVLSSASALSSQTAKLPRINLAVEGTTPMPGISTATSLSHGFVFGFAALTDGLCTRLAATLEGPVFVVGAGGFALQLAAVTSCFDVVRPDLLLEGLRILHDELTP